METIAEEIKRLKAERNAVILAHNYVNPEIQDIADFLGDSLELSFRAKESGADVIVFCGVRFMAETAKLLSPKSKVLIPIPEAGCAMADMVNAKMIQAYKKDHPAAFFVAYVNTTAETKAEVDLCCTSGNVEKVLKSIPEDQEVMFLPDRNLGGNMNRKMNRAMELWKGCCPVHDAVTPEMIRQAKNRAGERIHCLQQYLKIIRELSRAADLQQMFEARITAENELINTPDPQMGQVNTVETETLALLQRGNQMIYEKEQKNRSINIIVSGGIILFTVLVIWGVLQIC